MSLEIANLTVVPNCQWQNATCVFEDPRTVAYISTIWVMLCTFFIVSMQLGFAMLEVGSCREAHRMTLLVKNVMDSVVSCVAFWAYCQLSWVPPSITFDGDGNYKPHLLIFHWSFCATAVTICSGSMAERTHLMAYMFYAVVMASFIYPVVACSAWGTDPRALLYKDFHNAFHDDYDYHDFAGSGVVHLTGGCCGLVGNILVGRRITREPESFALSSADRRRSKGSQAHQKEEFTAADSPTPIALRPEGGWMRRFDSREHDAREFAACNYLQTMGMLVLWVGWYGFNAGSAQTLDHAGIIVAPSVAWNTTLAAGAGGLGAYLYCYCFHRSLDVGLICNGVLSGLVAITACCDVADASMSLLIGIMAGLVVYPLSSIGMRWLRLDDPVDAVPVHAACGLFGVLMTGVCRPLCQPQRFSDSQPAQEKFCSREHSVGHQLVAQVWGAFTIIWWASSISLLVWGMLAVSEATRAKEAQFLQEADSIVCDLVTSDAATEVDSKWRTVAQHSPIARRILRRHGWKAGSFEDGGPRDPWALRQELQKAREAHVESALEASSKPPLEMLARLFSTSTVFRRLAVLRLRISPSSELSGLGAADGGGESIPQRLRNVLQSVTSEKLKEQQASEDSLQREVRELAAIVQSQDALLQTIATRRRTGAATGPQAISRGTPSHCDASELSAATGSSTGSPELGEYRHRQLAQNGLIPNGGLFNAVNILSDGSSGAMTPHSAMASLTPPPTLLGLARAAEGVRSHRTGVQEECISEVASQLVRAMEAQQTLLRNLHVHWEALGSRGSSQVSSEVQTPNSLPGQRRRRSSRSRGSSESASPTFPDVGVDDMFQAPQEQVLRVPASQQERVPFGRIVTSGTATPTLVPLFGTEHDPNELPPDPWGFDSQV